MKALRLCICIFFSLVMLTACGGGGGGNTGNSSGHSAGIRIPSCLSDSGIDLFAAQGDQVLGLTWNNIGGADFSGGYRVRYGTESGSYPDQIDVPCATIDC